MLKKEITDKDIFDILKDQDFKRFLTLIKNNLMDKDPATVSTISKFFRYHDNTLFFLK